MSERSAFQRFVSELRRRHVPQTAAVYLVAAWAAIEFSDVVVPNLDGPVWVVKAVIVAAGVGLPVVLILAWFYDWTTEGIRRTPAAEPGEESGAPSSSPWPAVVAVLIVGIGSALVVAALLAGERGDETVVGGVDRPTAPGPPEIGPGTSIDDRIRQSLEGLEELEQWEVLDGLRSLQDLDSSELAELTSVARDVAERAGMAVMIQEPRDWRKGLEVPASLAEGDTLMVEGLALDTAGVAAVLVDGRTVAEAEHPAPTLHFQARLVGTGSVGMRGVPIVVRTADGREIRREYRIVQLPGGTP
ncbi:MAG: hypothetical protein ACOCVZ_02285 [Gemmatimonadota bacterium]